MKRMIGLSAALSLVLGTAAYAASPKSAPPTSAPPKALAFNSQGTITGTVPIFSAANLNVPGATGRTIIRGNNSTIARDAEATEMQQTGAVGGD